MTEARVTSLESWYLPGQWTFEFFELFLSVVWVIAECIPHGVCSVRMSPVFILKMKEDSFLRQKQRVVYKVYWTFIWAWIFMTCLTERELPSWLSSKESSCNAGDAGSIPGLGWSTGEGSGSPLQYSCLENPIDRGAYWPIVYEVTKSWTLLST